MRKNRKYRGYDGGSREKLEVLLSIVFLLAWLVVLIATTMIH